MKAITVFITMTLLVISGAAAVIAADSPPIKNDQLIKDVGEKLRADISDLMTRYKGLSQANKIIKEAGLSYQKALVADTATPSAHTTRKQQALMAGVYTFDATYAALFLRKKELATSLKARRTLEERLGFGMAMTPRLKKMINNPETINDFNECTEAFDEFLDQLVEEQLTTDQRMVSLVDAAYGAITEGLYVVSESIAQAGYPGEMLDLMDEQLVRINFMIRLINIFRGKENFETAVALEPRLKVLEKLKGLMEVEAPSATDAKEVNDSAPPLRYGPGHPKGSRHDPGYSNAPETKHPEWKRLTGLSPPKGKKRSGWSYQSWS